MKRILKKYIFLLSSVLLLTPVNIHANNEEYSVIVNEKKISFDDTSGKPMIIEGRMYVPLRIMGDLLGVDTDWDESSKSITFRRDDIIIQLRIGNPIALINGKEVHIEEGFATVPIM